MFIIYTSHHTIIYNLLDKKKIAFTVQCNIIMWRSIVCHCRAREGYTTAAERYNNALLLCCTF